MLISYQDHQAFAAELLYKPNALEIEVRRAISACYYGLFHRLATQGAAVFGLGGTELRHQAARAYSHSTMRKVCEQYVRSAKQKFPAPLDRLVPTTSDSRLITVADAFVQLQDARHAADYDTNTDFDRRSGLEMLQLAESSHRQLDQIQHLPETHVFLAALLLADRWTRRG